MEGSRKVCVAFVFAVLSSAVAVAAPGTVTEAEAVRRFLSDSPQAKRAPVAVRSAEATFHAESRLDDPRVAYEIEDAAGVRDELLTLEQAVPITGRRGLLATRAGAAGDAIRLEEERRLQDEVYGLEQTFHEVLYHEHVLERLRRGAERLGRTVAILEAREREGEGSGYDVMRSEQELADLRMTIAATEASVAAARARFGAFFPADAGMATARLEGELLPVGPVPGVEASVRRALSQRPDLRALVARQDLLEYERRAARRGRFPDPVLTAGWKRTEELGESDTGYVASVSVALPVFGRGRLAVARATAERDRAQIEEAILTRRIRADVEAAVARETAARLAASEYGEELERRADELHRIAELRYQEGEGDIVELLDAHRTSLAASLRSLELQYEARRAAIERRRVVGDEVKP